MNKQGPVKERVTTIGQGGKRFWMYPASFSGEWLNKRRLVAVALIIFYFLFPWLKINGEQVILMDIADRKFAFFGFIFWPQDLLIFWFFLMGALVCIILITAQWGRLWCGWACPQTVFLEHVFRRIEIFIEGDAAKRRKLDRGPLTLEKVKKKTLKFLAFFVVSSHFANTAICYFVGTDEVLHMTFSNPGENQGWFSFMLFINFLFFLDFVWFREQFCIIACPYGRFQSVLLDEHSTIVGYDYNRGEPRGVLRKNRERGNQGDCIDCNRCVAVCPTGIDIRMGLQMECINCTACLDACDEVMGKIGKPKKLIRYTSEMELDGRKRRWIRPRVVVYTVIFLGLWTVGAFKLNNREGLIMRMIRPPGTSFTLDEQAFVTNHFQAKATNKTDDTMTLTVKASDGVSIVTPFPKWTIKPQETAVNEIFLRMNRNNFSSSGKEKIKIEFYNGEDLVIQTEVTIMGPAK